MANLLRLSPATMTFLVFFYSTTVLTSYFYPLDWRRSHSRGTAKNGSHRHALASCQGCGRLGKIAVVATSICQGNSNVKMSG